MRSLTAVIDIEQDNIIATGSEEHTIEAVVDSEGEFVLFDINGTDSSIAIVKEPDTIRLLLFNLDGDKFTRIEEFLNKSKRIERLLNGDNI